jgi:transposase
LLNIRHVSPFRRGNKNDRNDCDAILDAARAIDIKPILVKTEQQQHIQHLHCMRELWKQNRTQRIKLLRGVFREQGFDCPLGRSPFLNIAKEILDEPIMQPIFVLARQLLEEIANCTKSIDACEDTIAALLVDDNIITRIDEVSGSRTHQQIGSHLLVGMETPTTLRWQLYTNSQRLKSKAGG